MLTLYYSPGACSMAIHVVLNELNVPFDTQKVDLSAPRTPEFLKLNSRGQVPVLTDGDVVVREGAAILSYLGEKYPTPLIPQSGDNKMAAFEAMMFCNATLHPAYSRSYFLNRQDLEAAAKGAVLAASGAAVQKLWDDVESQLNKTRYMAGDAVTIADIMLTVMANWAIPNAPQFGPKTKSLLAEISSRPSYQKALAAEGVSYKAAA